MYNLYSCQYEKTSYRYIILDKNIITGFLHCDKTFTKLELSTFSFKVKPITCKITHQIQMYEKYDS